MTTTSPPPFFAATPFWMAGYVVDQQMRFMQMLTETMIRANPWFALMRARGVDPLTADGALGEGDAPCDIDLEAGGAEAEPRMDPVAEEPLPPVVVATIAPAPAAAEDTAATLSPADAAPADPAPRKPAAEAAPPRSRARRQPASPPVLPGNPDAPKGKGE
ncbi:hypothetical protein [Rhodovulum strictum]|uniref:Uncharacterized protein n=1 Tax=Rhodovulum strictum TaxID=58314 RepID=A0A844BG45_9RHOB|nr:hypothetical protein [Rhodovulum strictum]MRH21508.1 hypothetical protein [Rhodovulum strictum]